MRRGAAALGERSGLALQFPDFDPAVVTIPAFHLGSLALGPFAIRWYALAYIAGILLGWRYCVGLVRNPRLWGARAPDRRPRRRSTTWSSGSRSASSSAGGSATSCFYMLVDPGQRADAVRPSARDVRDLEGRHELPRRRRSASAWR